MSRGSPRQPRGGRALGSAAAAVLLRAVCVLLLHASPAVSVAVSSEQELRQAVLRGDSVVQIETPLLRVSGTGPPGALSAFPPVVNSTLEVTCALPEGGRCVLQLESGRPVRFFTVGAGGQLALSGITFRGGAAAKGGALFVGPSGNVTVRDCAFEDNAKDLPRSVKGLQGGAVYIDGGCAHFANVLFLNNGRAPGSYAQDQDGGAVYVKGGSGPISPECVYHMECNRCTFTNNTATTGGALVMARNARIRVSNSAFEGNAAGSGGAIWAGDDRVDQASSLLVVGGNLQVDNSTFLGNSAAQAGGAAAFDGLTTWVLTNSNFSSNICAGVGPSMSQGQAFGAGSNRTRGGAVAASGRGGTMYGLVEDCVFSNNSAHLGGAMALSAVQQGHLYWQKSTFEGNLAVNGGAMWLQDIQRIALLNECVIQGGFAEGHGGGIWANSTSLRARRSRFANTQANRGGAMWCSGQSDVTLDSCQVVENGAKLSGGGLHVEGHAVLAAEESHFTGNYVMIDDEDDLGDEDGRQGGAVAIFSTVKAGRRGPVDPPVSSFKDCTFSKNFARNGGAMLVSARADLFRCNFSNNSATSGGSLKVMRAMNLLATNCTFQAGVAKVNGGGVAVEVSKAEFKGCFFLSNLAADAPGTEGGGGGMHVSGSVAPLSIKLQDCLFAGNQAQYGGGALFGNDSSVRVDLSEFRENSAKAMGGAVRLGALSSRRGQGGAHAEFSYVTFIGHSAGKGAGAIDIRQSKAKLDNCKFLNNRAEDTQGGQDQWGGAVRILDRLSEVDFNACDFNNNTATYGGALYAGIGAGLLLSSCGFRGNSARSGGAIRVESSAEVMISACTFVRQRAEEGGAVSALGPPTRLIGATTAWVRSSNFIENEADSSGGAIYAVGSDLFMKSNTFLHNRVKGIEGQGGGAFSLNSVEFSGDVVPGQMTFEDDQFTGHQAHTGGTGTVEGSSMVSFVQTTLRNSSALGNGGALFGRGAHVQLNFIHGSVEQAWAGALGGCVALEGGGSLFSQGTKFRQCRAGQAVLRAARASNQDADDDGADDDGAGDADDDGWQPFSDERVEEYLRQKPPPQETAMGGAVSLNNSTAYFDKQVELSDNFANGWGGAIGAFNAAQLFAKQTRFERNTATGGGGAIYASNSKVALLSGPRFYNNAVTKGIAAPPPSPQRHRRLLAGAPAQLTAAGQPEIGGGALHLANGTMAVCDQCEFSANTAARGEDVFLGPNMSHGDIYISSTAFGTRIDVYPPEAAPGLSQACWPLACGVSSEMQSTTCGESAVHTTQLTRGTSSLGFAESVTVTTQDPYFEDPQAGQCVQTCLDTEQVLFPPSKCTALVPSPPTPFPFAGPRQGETDEFPANGPGFATPPPPVGDPPAGNPTSQDGPVDPVDADTKGSPVVLAAVSAAAGIAAVLMLVAFGLCLVRRAPAARTAPDGSKPRGLSALFTEFFSVSTATGGDATPSQKHTPSSINSPSSVISHEPTSRDAILVKSHLTKPSAGKGGGASVAITLEAGPEAPHKPTTDGASTSGPERKSSAMSTTGSGSVASQGSGLGHIGPRPESLPNFPAELDIDWNVLLGSGGYGQVFLGTWSPKPPPSHACSPGGAPVTPYRPRRCAVKVMTPSRNSKERADKIRSFQEEAGMMGRFQGVPQVVDMIAADVAGPTCWIIYELLPHGTLASRVHDHTRPRLSLMTTLQYCIDIAKGLEALHAVGVVHRDLKLDNLLMDEDNRPKLIDFGISRERDPNKSSITTECVGTWAYMAPEQFSNRVSEKVDVYALGVCIWEIWTRQRPWQDLINDSPWQLVIAIMNDDERLPIPQSLPQPLRKLVEDCWLADPRARPSMAEIVTRLERMASKVRRRRRTRSASCDGMPIYDDPRLTATVERLASAHEGSSPSTPSRVGSGWAERGFGSIVFNDAGLPSRDRTEALAEVHQRHTQSAKELSHMVPSGENTPAGVSRFAAQSETNVARAPPPTWVLVSPEVSPAKSPQQLEMIASPV